MARRIADDTPKYEPTIYNYKCTDESNSNSPSPSPPAIKEEPSPEQCTQFRKSPQPGDGEHSDNGSEVSDEGYRSLGAVQPPPAAGLQTTQTVVDAQSKYYNIFSHSSALFLVSFIKGPFLSFYFFILRRNEIKVISQIAWGINRDGLVIRVANPNCQFKSHVRLEFNRSNTWGPTGIFIFYATVRKWRDISIFVSLLASFFLFIFFHSTII